MSDNELLSIAKDAATNAYSPYSNIKIGAAVLGRNGNIYRGCNIENSSYGLTICAERSAMINAVSADPIQEYLAIAVYSDDLTPVPCGACAQFISEFEKDIKVIIGHKGSISISSLSKILPSPFNLRHE